MILIEKMMTSIRNNNNIDNQTEKWKMNEEMKDEEIVVIYEEVWIMTNWTVCWVHHRIAKKLIIIQLAKNKYFKGYNNKNRIVYSN